jgi:hypothetical protein
VHRRNLFYRLEDIHFSISNIISRAKQRSNTATWLRHLLLVIIYVFLCVKFTLPKTSLDISITANFQPLHHHFTRTRSHPNTTFSAISPLYYDLMFLESPVRFVDHTKQRSRVLSSVPCLVRRVTGKTIPRINLNEMRSRS